MHLPRCRWRAATAGSMHSILQDTMRQSGTSTAHSCLHWEWPSTDPKHLLTTGVHQLSSSTQEFLHWGQFLFCLFLYCLRICFSAFSCISVLLLTCPCMVHPAGINDNGIQKHMTVCVLNIQEAERCQFPQKCLELLHKNEIHSTENVLPAQHSRFVTVIPDACLKTEQQN